MKKGILFIFLLAIQMSYQSDIDISSLSNIDQIKQTNIDFNININFEKQM